MRVRVGAVLAVIGAVGLLAGCSTSTTGVAGQAPYQPLPLASVTAIMATPVDGAVAYSPDGGQVVTRTDTRLCIGAVHTSKASHRTCADPGAPTSQVLISPDGRTIAAVENMAVTFRGRLWLISADDGAVREVSALDDRAARTTSTAGPAGGTGAGGTAGSAGLPYTSITWTADGSLLAVANAQDGGTHLVRVDPASGRPDDLGRLMPGDGLAAGILLTAGDVAVVPVVAPSGPPQLVVVDLADGSTRTVTLTGKMITTSTQALPLALAPDGRSAVLWLSDPVNFTFSPPVRADLDTGRLTVITGSGELMPSAVAYSPDGSQLAIVGRTKHDHTDALAVLPIGGGTPRTVVTLDSDATPGLDLAWGRTDLLVPALSAGMVSLGGMAPVQLAG